MNHTLSDSQLEEMIKSAVNSSGPLPPDEKFSLLISALRELQERRKADSEPVAYTDERNLGYIDRGRETAYLWGKQNSEAGDIQLYRHAQPASVVLGEVASAIEELKLTLVDCNRYNYCSHAVARVESACRAAMLQAEPVCTCPSGDGSLRWPCPVHPGNSPAIPDSARDALEKALAAMEFMGDTLNNLDAVCTEDVELVAPAFDAVRSVLAAAQQEVKGE